MSANPSNLAIAPLTLSPIPRSAILEINLGNIAKNYFYLSTQLHNAKLAAVVKADAYGLGLTPVAQALYDKGCRQFFVAQLEEAIDLRNLLSDVEIYVLNGLMDQEADIFVHHNLIPVLNHQSQIETWKKYIHANEINPPAAIHIDTGMNRLGIPESELDTTMDSLNFKPTLVMTHLAAAEEIQNPLNQLQLKKFRTTLQKYNDKFKNAVISFANSSGIFLGEDYQFDLARAGVALYGANPTPHRKNPMLPVVTLKARVIQVKEVLPGAGIGYNSRFHAPHKMLIATLGLGYADGLLRATNVTGKAKNQGYVMFNDKRCPIIGAISMDSITIDVTDQPSIKTGDYVELLNADHTVDDLAEYAGTIAYEVLTNLGARFERLYLD